MAQTLVRSGTVLGAAVAALLLLDGGGSTTRAAVASVPHAALDDALPPNTGEQTAVLAGGCFWGIEAVFEHVKGVTSVTSGYAGGSARTATYDQVGAGTSGHAESVRITFDPSQISYGRLLHVFFAVAHDPTQRNRQGPDVGTQYRSAIFYSSDEQKRVAEAYIDQLNGAKTFSRPIVTEVVPLDRFYPAEAYHQDYAVHHPNQPYIVIHDLPKVERLRRQLPELYRDSRVP